MDAHRSDYLCGRPHGTWRAVVIGMMMQQALSISAKLFACAALAVYVLALTGTTDRVIAYLRGRS